MSRRRQAAGVVEPRREELEALVHRYRHLTNEHHRAAPGTSARRRHEARVVDVRNRFERRLAEWVSDPELQDAWRAFLENDGPEPGEPQPVVPLVFRGRGEVSGSVVEVRGGAGEYAVEVDGTLIERIDADKDFAVRHGPVRFRVVEQEYVEFFAAPDAALEALAAYREDPEPAPWEDVQTPPWDHAADLLEDGLVGVRFDITPRGHRALGPAA
jgi:hypothetical protein